MRWRRGSRFRARGAMPLLLVLGVACSDRPPPLAGTAGGTGAAGTSAAGAGQGGGGVLSSSLEGKRGTPTCTVLDGDTARTTLGELCGESCLSAAEVVANIEMTCRENGPYERVLDGCGYVVIEYSAGLHGSTFVYDRDTGELVGMSSFRDLEWGPCVRYRYVAGVLPVCAQATTCHVCSAQNDGDAGGEGGATSGAECLPF